MISNLRKIRKSNGYTQEALAKAIGATKRQVGAWERGENDLPLDYAVEIADLFNCSLDSIARSSTGVTTDEEELLAIWRALSPQGQQQLMLFARGCSSTFPKNNQFLDVQAS